MKEVAGYLVPIDIAHQVLATLGVDTGGVDDNFLELPINDWLADHEKDFFAAVHDRSPKLGTPDVLGVMFITQAVEIVAGAARPKETAKDMKVKKWLVEEGGAPEDKVEWLRFDDVHNMTLNGTKPLKTNIRFHFEDRGKHVEFRREMEELEKLQAEEMEKLDAAKMNRSCMKEVAGYLVPIDIAHQVLATFGVDTSGVDDNFLELPINDWLADHEKDFFAAVHDRSPKLGTPDVLGVMFITQAVEIVAGAARPKESEKGMKVKKWLVDEGDAPEEEILALQHLSHNHIRLERS